MDERERSSDAEHELAAKVGRKASRKIRARGERGKRPWHWLGMFGLVGWAVAIPTVIGVVVGGWLDRTFDGRASWTLTMLFAGIGLGCLNAWYWVRRESSRP